MHSFLVAALFTILVWWLSTGLIVRLADLRGLRRGHGFLAASLLLGLGLWGVVFTRTDATVAGAYGAFASTVLVWGWQELAFLLGLITGPNRKPCPPVTGWARAWHAFTAIAHHELALVVLGLAVMLPTWDASNRVAASTWAVLWVMRLSAKLNLFLGVRNCYETFLPPSLQYLVTYFARRRFNGLFPLSFMLTLTASVLVIGEAFGASSAYERASAGLLGSLLTLALIEHILLMVPFEPDLLWRWALRHQR